MLRPMVICAWLCAPSLARAADALGTGQLLRTALSLALVLALILLSAWVLRRVGGERLRPSARLRVIASTALGTRERITLVEVDDRRLLLAVAPGQVSLLRDCGAVESTAVAAPVSEVLG